MRTPSLSRILRNREIEKHFLKDLDEENTCTQKDEILDPTARPLSRKDILNLRKVSRRVATAIATAGYIDAVFRKVYVAPQHLFPRRRQSKHGLRNIGKHCRLIHIKLCNNDMEQPQEALRVGGDASPPDAVFSDEQPTITQSATEMFCIYRTLDHDGKSDWPQIFRCIPNLTTVTIETGSHPGGLCRTSVSDTLTAIRTAFESTKHSNVTAFRFRPADMAYLSHFSWAGPAMGEAKSWAARTWANITTLELQIQHTRIERGAAAYRQVIKQLHAWLISLSSTITVLKYHYVNPTSGPHPFGLHAEMDKAYWTQPPLRFPRLKEMWMGRVKDEAIWRLRVDECAPKLRKYMCLISGGAGAQLEFKERDSPERWDRIVAYNNESESDLNSEEYRDTWYIDEMRGQLALLRRDEDFGMKKMYRG